MLYTLPTVRYLILASAVLCLLAIDCTFAQTKSLPKLGVIDAETVRMTAYSPDSSVAAVMLIDYGEVNFDYDDMRGLTMRMKVRARIKLLKESALERASVSIPFHIGSSNDKSEAIDAIQGFTYNYVDGKVVSDELSRKAIVREKLSDEYYAYKFNLTNVRKGSVIEYAYERITPLNYKSEPDTWNFQASIPVVWSEYRITIPNLFYYKMTMGGYLPLAINEKEDVNVSMGRTDLSGQGVAYRFVVKDAPAFNGESFITTASDYLSRIEFELARYQLPGQAVRNFSNSWENLDRTLHAAEWYGRQLKRSGFLKPVVDAISQRVPATDTLGRLREAYGYIQKSMKWDESYSRGSADGLKKVFDNKKGSATEINLLLVLLLRELEIPANPVLLSTRSNGRIIEHIPLLDRFNYTIAQTSLAGKSLFMDATGPYLPLGTLPVRCLNGRGRLLDERGSGSFVDIIPNGSRTRYEVVEAEIDPASGEVKGTYRLSLSGYEALAWREANASIEQNELTEKIQKDNAEWEIENVQISNANDLEKAIEITHDFVLPDMNQSADVIYFNPMLAGRITKHDFKNDSRIYPLDFATIQQHTTSVKLKLPAGYMATELPANEMLVLPENGGRFLYSVIQKGNEIQLQSRLVLSRTTYSADEYAALRQFHDKVAQKHSQPLILKKQAKP
jgi:hypothetical protein